MFIAANNQQIISLTYHDIAGEWDHHYGTHGKLTGPDEMETAIRQGGGVYLNQFLPGQLQLDYVGSLDPRDPTTATALARFDDWAVLERANAWREGTRIENRRYIELTESNGVVPERMLIGTYDRASGARALATATDGAPFQDNAAPIDLSLPALD